MCVFCLDLFRDVKGKSFKVKGLIGMFIKILRIIISKIFCGEGFELEFFFRLEFLSDLLIWIVF